MVAILSGNECQSLSWEIMHIVTVFEGVDGIE